MRATVLANLILLALLLPAAGLPQDLAIAPQTVAEWQARAEHGDARAAFQLGQLYTAADSVPRDAASAARWYRVAAELGLPEAQFALGLRYATGQGVSRDLRRAHMWINLAAVKSVPGSWEARDRLADLMTGDELAMAVRLAIDWIPKTAPTLTTTNRPVRPLP